MSNNIIVMSCQIQSKNEKKWSEESGNKQMSNNISKPVSQIAK